MTPPTAAAIQDQILEYLRERHILAFAFPRVERPKRWRRLRAADVADQGVSDIIACLAYGRFLAITVRPPDREVSIAQVKFLGQARQLGGLALIVTSLDDVIAHGF